MTYNRYRAIHGLTLALLACTAGCAPSEDARASSIGKASNAVSLGQIASDIVQNGAFTNLFVFPTPSTESWEAHIASLRSSDAASFSRASIDAASDRMMDTTWPTYLSGLFQ